MKKILVFIDGLEFSKTMCEYGVYLSKILNLPLMLVNIVEKQVDVKNEELPESITLNQKEILFEKLENEERIQIEQDKNNNKAILNSLKEFALQEGVKECQILQKNGTLNETLEELSENLKIVIVGIRGKDSDDDEIGHHIEELVRAAKIPILVVNGEFRPIKSIVMAYDGSEFSKRSFEIASIDPVFPDTIRYIVNVNKDEEKSQKLLDEAKEIFKDSNFKICIKRLDGDGVTELLEYQDKVGADAIAMGAYSSNKLTNIIFGSFTHKMLLNSKKPVILYK